MTERGPSSRGAGSVAIVLGAAVSGLGAYAFQVIGTRGLGEVGYAPVGVLWTLQYLIFSVLLHPVETFLARLVARNDRQPGQLGRTIRRVAAWTVAVSVVLGVVSHALRDRLFLGSDGFTLALVAIVLTYGAFVVLRGVLAGAGHYRDYAVATGAESTLRVVAGAAVVAGGASALGVAATLPIGAAIVVLAWLHRGPDLLRREAPALLPGGLPVSGPLAFLLVAGAVNASAQLLLAGAPLVLLALDAPAAAVSVCFVTVTLARAPLVFGYGGVLSRILPPLTRRAEAGDTAGLRRAGLLLVPASVSAALLGGLVAAAVGPSIIAATFGAGLRPSAGFVGLSVAAAVLATGNLLLNQVLIARHSERRLPLPWLIALAAALVVVAVVPWAPLDRVGLAFLVGEVVAVGGLVVALVTAPPLRAPTPRAASLF